MATSINNSMTINGEKQIEELSLDGHLTIAPESRLIVRHDLLVSGDIKLNNRSSLVVIGDLNTLIGPRNTLYMSDNTSIEIKGSASLYHVRMGSNSKIIVNKTLTVKRNFVTNINTYIGVYEARLNSVYLDTYSKTYINKTLICDSLVISEKSHMEALDMTMDELIMKKDSSIKSHGNIESASIRVGKGSYLEANDSVISKYIVVRDKSRLEIHRNLASGCLMGYDASLYIAGILCINDTLELIGSNLLAKKHLQVDGTIIIKGESCIETKQGAILAYSLFIGSSGITINNDVLVTNELDIINSHVKMISLLVGNSTTIGQGSSLETTRDIKTKLLFLSLESKLITDSICVTDQLVLPSPMTKDLLFKDDPCIRNNDTIYLKNEYKSIIPIHKGGLKALSNSSIKVKNDISIQKTLRLDPGSSLIVGGCLTTHGPITIGLVMNKIRTSNETTVNIQRDMYILYDIEDEINIEMTKVIVQGDLKFAPNFALEAKIVSMSNKGILDVKGIIAATSETWLEGENED